MALSSYPYANLHRETLIFYEVAFKTDTTLQGNKLVKVSFCHCIMLANCGSCSQGKPIHQGCLSLSTQIAADAVVSLDKRESGGKPEHGNVLKTLRPGDLKGSVAFVRENL